jgi:DNA repair photolyase
MIPIEASKLLIVEGVEDDPLMKARADRLRSGIICDDVRTVDDAELNRIVETELTPQMANGMHAEFKPVVIFNRIRLNDSDEEQQRRLDAYPALNRLRLNGYGGFDWRESGSADHRERTGLVCQPAWAIHSVVGCHFRCAYCHLSRFFSVMMNMEEFVGGLDEQLAQCPGQTLFQWDNYTDAVCFEPEYGATKLLVDYFANRPGQALELYAGKSGHVDYMLDYDHRGHTVCCWSMAAHTQSTQIEHLSDPTGVRIEAMRKCAEAGYPVRVRLSPIVPVKDWREENRAMIEQLFDAVTPDIITMETIRFMDSARTRALFDTDLLDEEYLAVLKAVEGQDHLQGCELPDDYRAEVYGFLFDQLDRYAPDVPVAFCREARVMWDRFADRLAARGQNPDRYVCNCGPTSAPAIALAH